MIFAIDRIEEGIAVCEDIESGDFTKLTLSQLPEDAREGDIVKENGGSYEVDHELTDIRKRRALERLKSLQRYKRP